MVIQWMRRPSQSIQNPFRSIVVHNPVKARRQIDFKRESTAGPAIFPLSLSGLITRANSRYSRNM